MKTQRQKYLISVNKECHCVT